MPSNIGLITLVVALGLVSASHAFRCYECAIQGDCLTEYVAVPCDQTVRTCYHVPGHFVKRGCGLPDPSLPNQDALVCSSELCNTSSRTALSMSLVAVICLLLAKQFF